MTSDEANITKKYNSFAKALDDNFLPHCHDMNVELGANEPQPMDFVDDAKQQAKEDEQQQGEQQQDEQLPGVTSQKHSETSKSFNFL